MKNIYQGNYLWYIVIPALLAIVSAFLVFVSPGLVKGLDIEGGTLLLVQTDTPVDALLLEQRLNEQFQLQELKVIPTGTGVRIQFKEDPVFASVRTTLAQAQTQLATDPEQAKQTAGTALEQLRVRYSGIPSLENLSPNQAVETAVQTLSLAEESFSNRLQETVFSALNLSSENALFQKRDVGSALGQTFWENALTVVAMGLVLIAIVIFAFFREFFPTLSIVLAAIIDILTALAGMAILGIPLSLVTLPALLMLIGYAVDTEILMSTRLFKKKEGTEEERAWESFKTGITMTGTTLGALLVMLVVSNYLQIAVIFEISAVLFFGLVGDVITSWLLNGPMLLWHAKRKHAGA